nr:MAG TPA: minor structural protein [Caudoviricetes sp.]
MEHYSNVVKAMIARSNARAADIADKIQARAYYQFQYVPPAGPLPGWSMEQQTEDAINEIGNIAYSSDEIAREAREIAQQAYNAAQAAIEMATNALTAAQNAQQTADTALNTANTAVTKADNAQASADAAQKAADAAQKSANDAQTAADNAQSTANTAIENASQALSAANEAKASADQSNQRLDVLEPIVDTLRWYENVTENIDFNTRVELERAFLQGTANTNGPVAGPGWLDVDDDYNETYIRQKFIAQADGACYVRFGTIVPDSSPIEVSSWTGWVKYALASELTSAVETINTSITSINGEITTIKGDITSIESDITELQGSLGSAEGDITAVTNALDAHKADYDNPHKVTAAQLGLATVYKYKGSVETYADLPTSGQQVGDVYNVKQADPDHNIEAGDNVAWDGEKWDILAGDTDLSGYAQLNAANTFTAANTFNSNIVVRAATAAGSAGIITLGEKPSSKTAQCLINAAGNGNLILQASENGIVGLQSGSVLQWSVVSDEENTKTSAYLHSTLAATYTPATGVVWEGNANTATKLATARTINGVPFDGTKDIVIESGQGEFLPLTGGTVTGPIYLPSTTPTTDTQAVTKKYVDDSVAGAGGGDVTAAGNNNFTGVNTFNNSTNFGSYIAVRSGDGSSAAGVINLGRLSGSTVQGASLSAVSTGQLNLTAGTGRNVVLQSREQQTAVNIAEFSSSQAVIYPNVLTIGMGSSGTVAMERGTEGDYRLHLVDNDVIVAGFNSNSNVAAFSAHQILFNSDGVSEEWALKNNTTTILDHDGMAMHLRTGNSNVGLELGSGTSGWALQCPADATDVRVARRLYVGSQGGVGNGVISADNTENCLYFCGTAENTYYSTPNTGNTISYQAAANVYLINTSINDAASLTMNFSNMRFHATVGSVPYMCKTLTFWFVTGATAPTVTWQFPSGAAVYYPKGVAPALTANASNIINVVAIVDDTDSFSIQVCDVVALPYSG